MLDVYYKTRPDYAAPRGFYVKRNPKGIHQMTNSEGELLTWVPEGEDNEGLLVYGYWAITDPNEENLEIAISDKVIDHGTRKPRVALDEEIELRENWLKQIL